MITSHLTDKELQLFVAEPEIRSDQAVAHVNNCAQCQSRAANYTTLINSLQYVAQPLFDFDLTKLVIAGLPNKKVPYGWLPAIAGGLSMLLIISGIAIFGSRLMQLFRSLPLSLLWLIIIPALVLLIMQAVMIANDHQRKMSLLINS